MIEGVVLAVLALAVIGAGLVLVVMIGAADAGPL